MALFEPKDYEQRRNRVLRRLGELNCQALVVEDPINLLYLTGLHLSTGTLVLSSGSTALYVDGRYIEYAKTHSPFAAYFEKDPELALFSLLDEEKGVKKVAFLSEQVVVEKKERWVKKIERHQLGPFTLVPMPHLLLEIRALKEPKEIGCLQRAATLAKEGLQFLKGEIYGGVSEQELVQKLKTFWLNQGGEGESFHPIIAFGENSAYPHHKPGSRKLKHGDLIQLDLGVQKEGYHSDLSYVIPFGSIPEELTKITEIVRLAKERAIQSVKPGLKLSRLDQIAREEISKSGYGDYFVHSLGHGVGLQVHEWPQVRSQSEERSHLKEGMCLTIEPGIYLPGLGGVRLEDTVVVTHDGHLNLTEVEKDT